MSDMTLDFGRAVIWLLAKQGVSELTITRDEYNNLIPPHTAIESTNLDGNTLQIKIVPCSYHDHGKGN